MEGHADARALPKPAVTRCESGRHYHLRTMGHQLGVGASGPVTMSKVVDAIAQHNMWVNALNSEFKKRVAKKQATEDSASSTREPASEEGIARSLSILSVLLPENVPFKCSDCSSGPCKLVRTPSIALPFDDISNDEDKEKREAPTASPGMYQSEPASPRCDDVTEGGAPDPEANWLQSRPPMLKRQGGMPELQAFVKRSRRCT